MPFDLNHTTGKRESHTKPQRTTTTKKSTLSYGRQKSVKHNWKLIADYPDTWSFIYRGGSLLRREMQQTGLLLLAWPSHGWIRWQHKRARQFGHGRMICCRLLWYRRLIDDEAKHMRVYRVWLYACVLCDLRAMRQCQIMIAWSGLGNTNV